MHPPPLDPSSIPTSSSSATPKTKMGLQRCQGESGFKLRKLNDDDVEEEANAIQIESNSTHAQTNNLVSDPEPEVALVPPAIEETQKMSARAQLYRLCGVRHWKAPAYEFSGPERVFTVKATIKIKEDSRLTLLECFGGPQPKKKMAAEQAAEAALWYLKNLGYTLEADKAFGRRRQKKNRIDWRRVQ